MAFALRQKTSQTSLDTYLVIVKLRYLFTFFNAQINHISMRHPQEFSCQGIQILSHSHVRDRRKLCAKRGYY
jgi:hypothetical protein